MDTPKSDRRTADRFPIERDLKYKVFHKRNGEDNGAGQTVNMSSTGLLFTTEDMLLPGRRLEVAISWPAQLDNKCPLKLVARGKVVRCEDGKAAMEIQQYEFRTAKASSFCPHP